MKFDVIIQNPPYSRSLHLDFFNKGLDVLAKNGRMVIIEPATWLINIRRNGMAKHYDAVKQRIMGHVESVVIENLNREFGTRQDVPFSITTVDMSQEFDTIDFTCCGEHRTVDYIYDCNLIGDYRMIWSIIRKVSEHCDMMKDHCADPQKSSSLENTGLWFQPFTDGLLNALGTNSMSMLFTAPNARVRSFHKCGEFGSQYIESMCKGGMSYDTIPTGERGGKMHCVCGTKEEIENWRHFTLENKLPLFFSIALTIDQHNNGKPFIPWLADRPYTDDEINELFGFSDSETRLIDTTIARYERNSPWFRRLICGTGAASDEEINGFTKSLYNA